MYRIVKKRISNSGIRFCIEKRSMFIFWDRLVFYNKPNAEYITIRDSYPTDNGIRTRTLYAPSFKSEEDAEKWLTEYKETLNWEAV